MRVFLAFKISNFFVDSVNLRTGACWTELWAGGSVLLYLTATFSCRKTLEARAARGRTQAPTKGVNLLNILLKLQFLLESLESNSFVY